MVVQRPKTLIWQRANNSESARLTYIHTHRELTYVGIEVHAVAKIPKGTRYYHTFHHNN